MDPGDDALLRLNSYLTRRAQIEEAYLKQLQELLNEPCYHNHPIDRLYQGHVVKMNEEIKANKELWQRLLPHYRHQAGHLKQEQAKLGKVVDEKRLELASAVLGMISQEATPNPNTATIAPTSVPNPAALTSVPSLGSLHSNLLSMQRLMEVLTPPHCTSKGLEKLKIAIGVALKAELGEDGRFDSLPFCRASLANRLQHLALPGEVGERLLKRLNWDITATWSEVACPPHTALQPQPLKSTGELWKLMGKLEGHNREAGQAQAMLLQLTRLPELPRIVAIDLEAFEYDNGKLLEFGVAVWEAQTPKTIRVQHHVIAENCNLRNGRMVPDHRDHFLFGTSQTTSLATAHAHLLELLSLPGVALAGHGLQSDLDMLALSQLPLPECPLVLDSALLHRQLQRREETCSLERLLHSLGIEARFLHNAGNDAAYTLLAILHMAGLRDLQK